MDGGEHAEALMYSGAYNDVSSAGYTVSGGGAPGVVKISRSDGAPFEIFVGNGNTFQFPRSI